MLQSYRRITSTGKFVPEIDGLRFIAILPVVLMHINTNFLRSFEAPKSFVDSDLNAIIHYGELGVRFFFAISGFVLANTFSSFYKKNKNLWAFNFKSYYYRRLTRLEPPFLISTLVLFFVVGLFVVKDLVGLIPNLIATLTYTHYFWFGKWSVINPVTWSLEVEVQFYLIAPFVGWFLFSKFKDSYRNIILAVLIIVTPLIFLSPGSIFYTNKHLEKCIVVYQSHFYVGILMASIYGSNVWQRVQKSYLFDIGFLVGVLGLYFFYPPKTHSYILFDFSMLLIMITCFKGVITNRFFSNSLISLIGGMCYSIYLLHYAVVFVLMKVTSHLVFKSFYFEWAFHMVLSIVVVLCCSFIFYLYCERPCMDKNWPSKLYNRMNRIFNK
ncbi:acyltransferase family protein [Mucilaginibacter calamicampi]|uniref:Acyltransferase family protein n=2 Tax=Mucilaginibacter calamicampi TaxID=1302352 RepID=A0ABW2YYK6_9SPHI